MEEAFFLNVYGFRPLQAAVGLGTENATRHQGVERDLQREAMNARATADLAQRIDRGGPLEAVIRSLIYIRLAEGRTDERGFAAIKEVAATLPAEARVGLVGLKDIMRNQFLIL